MKNSKFILSVLCIFILSVIELRAQDSKLRLYSVSAGIGKSTFHADFPDLYKDFPSILGDFLEGTYRNVNFTSDIAFRRKNTMYSFFMEFGKDDRSGYGKIDKTSYEGFSITIGGPVGKKQLVFEPNIGLGYYFYHQRILDPANHFDEKFNKSRFGVTLRLKLLLYPTPKFGFGANGNIFASKGFSNYNINFTIQYRFK